MTININHNRINIQSGNSGFSARRRDSSSGNERPVIPAKADINNIPAPETLQTMIRSAVESLRSGIFWERGTILNLLV